MENPVLKVGSKLISMAVVVCAMVCVSCNDDASGPSKRNLLVDKAWMAIGYELDGEDITDEWEECDLDNTITFLDDGTLLADVGEELCEESETNTGGTWQLRANETVLRIHPTGESASDWDVVELTENSLALAAYSPVFGGEVTLVFVPL